MKRIRFSLLFLALLLFACSSKKTDTLVETSVPETSAVVETTKVSNSENSENKTANKMSERQHSFDPSIQFVYTGTGNEMDKYLKVITEDMVKDFGKYFEGQGAVEIPTPYISRTDDSDINDIKVYGNFTIDGYQMSGTVFYMKNGGSFPGCYHLKDEDGKITVVSKEIAEDGSNNWTSLVKICNGDESLAEAISNKREEGDSEKLRCDYAKMYAKANNLRLSGIKDYGWPIILMDDISDASFLYNFYNSYFEEVRQQDSLNDMFDRLENLKNKYMTEDVLNKLSDMSLVSGADMVINAQDVTEQMLDTLQVDDNGDGNLLVKMEQGAEKPTEIKVKLGIINGKKMIVDMY